MNPVPEPGWGAQPAGAPTSQSFPTQQPAYGYPPAGGYPTGNQPGQFGPPGYPGVPVRSGSTASAQLVAGALLVLAGVLAIVGSFLTLDTITTSGSTVDSSNTGWSFTFLTGANSTSSVTQWLGLSLAIGGALAIVGGGLLLLGGNRPLARPLAIAGAGLAFGATLTSLSTVLTDISLTSKQAGGSGNVADHPGIAFYLLIASALGAVIVLVMLVRAATVAAVTTGTSPLFAAPSTAYASQVSPMGYGTSSGYQVAPPSGFAQQPMPQQQPPTPPTGYGQPPTYGQVYPQQPAAYPQQQPPPVQQPWDEQPGSSAGQTTHIQPPGQQ